MLRGIILGILLTVLSTPAVAKEWWVSESDHFVVYSEGTEAEVKEFSERLERVDMAMRFMQNMPIETGKYPVRLTIYRFGETNDIARLAGNIGSGVAGFFIPNAAGPVAFVPTKKSRDWGAAGTRRTDAVTLDIETVLFHEYAHYFMFQHFNAAYPGWYTEGFAEVYGVIQLMENGAFRLGAPAQHRGSFLHNDSYHVRKLFQSAKDAKPEDSYRHYTVGWLLSHYLTFEESRKGQLKKYLDALNAGTSSQDAAVAAFGDLNTLNDDLRKYLNSNLKGIEVKPANYKTPDVQIRTMTPAEIAMFDVKIRSKRGVSKKNADGVASDAKRDAANFPNDAYAQTALAEALFDADDLEGAEAAADRAIAADSNAYHAYLYKGLIEMKRAEKDKSRYAEARKWFAKAYALNNNDAAALVYNYDAYYKEGGPIAESALIGLDRAYELAPYGQELRWKLTRQLLNENRLKSARVVIGPIAFSPHGGKVQEAAAEIVNNIDANKTAEALKIANEQISKMENPED